MMPGRASHRGAGRGNGRLSARGDGRPRTNGRHGASESGSASVPARQTLGFQATDSASDSRFAFVALCLMGKTVQVTTTDGSLYEGVFHTWQGAGRDLHVVLRFVYTLKGAKGVEVPRAKPAPITIIYSRDFVSLDAKDVKLGAEDVAPIETLDTAFLADSEIAGGKAMLQRELQPFAFDMTDNVPGVTDAGGLEDSVIPRNGAGWRAEDMFQENSAKFGTVSTFDENLYTTRLDKANAGISEAEAARVAAAIMAHQTTDAHVVEERGIELDDGRTEEERYSGVARAAAPAAAPPAPPAGASQPARIPNPRKEVNDVRNHLLAGKGSFSKSPLQEFTIMDNMRHIEALGLNPGTGNKGVNAKYASQFHEWKSERASDERRQAAALGSPAPGASAPAAPPAAPPEAAPAAADATAAPAPAPEPKKPAFSFKFNVNASEFAPVKPFTPPSAAPLDSSHINDAASSGRADSGSAASSLRDGNAVRRENKEQQGRRDKGGPGGPGGSYQGRGPHRPGMSPPQQPQHGHGQHMQHPQHPQHPQHFQQVAAHMSHPSAVHAQFNPVMSGMMQPGMPGMQMPMQGPVMNQPMVRVITPQALAGYNGVHGAVPVRTQLGSGGLDHGQMYAVQQAHMQSQYVAAAQYPGMQHPQPVAMAQPRPVMFAPGPGPVFLPSHAYHRSPE